jgi:hypothetical protein
VRFKDVRRSIVPGNFQSLWRAVKIARDVNTTTLPSQLYLNNETINAKELPDKFASFFDRRVRDLTSETDLDENVYNGRKLVKATNRMFMDAECMLTLKPKNSKGFDRIPKRVLRDCMEYLLPPPYQGCFN